MKFCREKLIALEEGDSEIQRLLSEITAKGGLPPVARTELLNRGSSAGSSYLSEGGNMVRKDKQIPRERDKIENASGNLELAAVDSEGCNLFHFWRDSGPSFDWHGPSPISEDSPIPVFSGNPAMIRSRFGHRGDFEVIVPRVDGGFSYYRRDNDDPALPWQRLDFATDAGNFDAVTLIQSNFGDPGNLEMVARCGDLLTFFWRDPGPEFKWNGPEMIAKGISGTPSMIQSTFGDKGNFELVVPMASGGLAYFWRDNDDDNLRWHGPLMFGTNLGKVESVGLIQSNFGEPGHLEIVAQVDCQLAFFWRDSGPDFRWNGPQYLTFSKTLPT